MQTLNPVNEAEHSPTLMLNDSISKSNQRKPPHKIRQTTLGLVKLRSENKSICINWSIIPTTEATSKRLSELISVLEQQINDCLDQPIEVLEDKLFYMCYIFESQLGGVAPKPQIVELFHLVNVIQEECSKSQNISKALLELGKISENYMKSYEFLCNFVKLINDLALIYGAINLYNYRFRFEAKVEAIKILNLSSLFSDIINMEIIWLSFIAQKPPLMHVLSEEVKELAALLQYEFYKTLNLFMESNRGNLQNKESIQSWLASKNISLVEDYGFRIDNGKKKPEYQSLKQNVFSCFCSRATSQAAELKDQLFEFEKIYRHFEAVILKSWYEMSKLIIN